jgi:hypothetical protein
MRHYYVCLHFLLFCKELTFLSIIGRCLCLWNVLLDLEFSVLCFAYLCVSFFFVWTMLLSVIHQYTTFDYFFGIFKLLRNNPNTSSNQTHPGYFRIKRCLVGLYRQFFAGWLVSFLRYLCLFEYSGVQRILCCVLFCFLLCTLCCQFLWIVLQNKRFSHQWKKINAIHMYTIYCICILNVREYRRDNQKRTDEERQSIYSTFHYQPYREIYPGFICIIICSSNVTCEMLSTYASITISA